MNQGDVLIDSYVVVHNIAKRHNVGTLARSATAFGVSELILVGRRDFNTFGSHGTTSHVRFRHFHSLKDAHTYLKEKDCDICGVEITENAMPVNQHPFKRSTAFLLGNEELVQFLSKEAHQHINVQFSIPNIMEQLESLFNLS